MSIKGEIHFRLNELFNKNLTFESLKIVLNEFSKEVKGFRLDLSIYDKKKITYPLLKEILSKLRIVIIIYDKKKKSVKLIKLLEVFQNIYEKILYFLMMNKINVDEYIKIYKIFLHIQDIKFSINLIENSYKDKTLLLSSLL